MKLNLDRTLIFLDVESTGLHVIRDRIVQLAMMKYSPGIEDPEERNWLINPGIPISEEAMQVHGITPSDVANKPVFRQVAAARLELQVIGQPRGNFLTTVDEGDAIAVLRLIEVVRGHEHGGAGLALLELARASSDRSFLSIESLRKSLNFAECCLCCLKTKESNSNFLQC